MSYYYNKIELKGTIKKIEELEAKLISKVGCVSTLNNYKGNEFYTEAIEIKDYEIFGDEESDDLVLELNLAALGFPLVRFWSCDDFKIEDNGVHSVVIKSYNPLDQIYIYNSKDKVGDNYKTLLPFHIFEDIDYLKEYYKGVLEFITLKKVSRLIDLNVKDEAIKDLILNSLI